jgi:hypothetical protein
MLEGAIRAPHKARIFGTATNIDECKEALDRILLGVSYSRPSVQAAHEM